MTYKEWKATLPADDFTPLPDSDPRHPGHAQWLAEQEKLRLDALLTKLDKLADALLCHFPAPKNLETR